MISTHIISSKQKALVRLMAQGKSEESVRAELKLTPAAYRDCLIQSFRALGVTTRVELMFFACSEEGRLLLKTHRGEAA